MSLTELLFGGARVVGGKAPMTTVLDMGGYRILNVAHPRDPREYESDLVTSKILYNYAIKVDQNYMRRDRDGSVVVPFCYLFFFVRIYTLVQLLHILSILGS